MITQSGSGFDLLTQLLADHFCRVDYDRVCIGCVCEGDDDDWRSCRIPERDHAWHARHLHELILRTPS